MSFLSFQFVIFIGIVFILYYTVFRNRQWILLLVSSYIFYLMGGVSALVFILSTTVTVYAAGRLMERVKEKSDSRKAAKASNKKILIGVVLINFGILLMLKYFNFIAENINSAFAIFEYDVNLPLVNVLLPLGISFYTFQSIGYAIDVYRDKYEAETNPARFALFISFFPQVIQGPISRYDNLGAKLKEKHKFSYKQFKFGAQLFLWGCFKKLVIADRAGILVSQVFDDHTSYDGLQVFVAVFLYAIQIYADFSGGIDMARGVAQALDIDLIQNFRRPYFATSVAEYWRRWHMSLTQWMRDYVFFPLTLSKASSRIGKWGRKHLKGNLGKQLPSYLPTFVTFFLIGIWHGAGWGFIFYGFYNATIIVLSMAFTPVFQAVTENFAYQYRCSAVEIMADNKNLHDYGNREMYNQSGEYRYRILNAGKLSACV